MQLWRKATKTILESNGVSLAKKVYLIVFFFGARMFAAHIVSFFLYCLLVPLCAISPEIPIPFWALVYTPVLVTMSTVVFTKEGWKTSVAFVLFENAMCVVKLSAMISGLFELSDAHEWVVTKKLATCSRRRRRRRRRLKRAEKSISKSSRWDLSSFFAASTEYSNTSSSITLCFSSRSLSSSSRSD